MSPNPNAGPIGVHVWDDVGAEYCTDTWEWDFSNEAYGWASSNTSVATLASAYTTFVAPGSASGSAQIQLQTQNIRAGCPVIGFVPQATQKAQVPTSLKVVSATSLGCPGSNNYGIQISITYQVMDQNNPPTPIVASGMDPWEQGTYISGGSFGPNELGSPTGANGQFTDAPVGVCQSLPLTKPYPGGTQNITIKWNGTSYPVRTNSWTETIPSGTAGFGHGTITNNVDINVSR